MLLPLLLPVDLRRELEVDLLMRCLPRLLAVLVLGEMCVLSCLFLFSQWGVIKADGSHKAVERDPHTSC